MGTQNRLFNQIADSNQRIVTGSRKAMVMADELMNRVNEAISFIKENKIENVYFRNQTIYTHPVSGDVCLHMVIGSTPRPDRHARPLDTDIRIEFDVEKQKARLLWDNIMYNVMGDSDMHKTQTNVSFSEYDRLEKHLEKFLSAEIQERMSPAARINLANAKAINQRTAYLPTLPYYC